MNVVWARPHGQCESQGGEESGRILDVCLHGPAGHRDKEALVAS